MAGLRVRKGDRVKVIAGKSAGHVGQVLRTDPLREKVWVEGANVQKRRAGERGPAQTEPTAAKAAGRRRVRQGIVVSDKADKTIVVRVDVTRRHRRYGKIMRTSSKIHAHDERNDAGAGDTVRVVECRPMSRTKRWRLTDVLEKAK